MISIIQFDDFFYEIQNFSKYHVGRKIRGCFLTSKLSIQFNEFLIHKIVLIRIMMYEKSDDFYFRLLEHYPESCSKSQSKVAKTKAKKLTESLL